MKRFFQIAGFAALLVFAAFTAQAADPVKANDTLKEPVPPKTPGPPIVLPERVLGKPDAPIRVDEYVSLTCSHCAAFYNAILPDLEKRYIDSGKVRFILHDYVMDAFGLRAATLARCMPEDEFYPFIKILYKNQQDWVGIDAEKILISYAKLGGLPEDKAQACLKDTRMQDAIIAERTAVEDKIEATPTFIITGSTGAKETIKGAQPVEEFDRVFSKLMLAALKH